MLMPCLALILGATAAPQVEPTSAARTDQESATSPTILVDLVVTDAKGGAITNLRPGELEGVCIARGSSRRGRGCAGGQLCLTLYG